MINFSIIIPVYNADKFLENAVESASQFAEVQEIILVEDGSTDDTLNICKKLVNKNIKVRLLRHPNGQNLGAGASRNLGITNASCDYIAFLDADDYFLPNRFDAEKIIFKEHIDADAVYGAIGVHYYSSNSKDLYKNKFLNDITTVNKAFHPSRVFPGLLNIDNEWKGYFSIIGLTIKKSSLSKIDSLMNTNLKLHQDTDFILRLSYYCNLYSGIIDQPIPKRGVHDNNRSINQKNKYKNRMLYFEQINFWINTTNANKIYKSVINVQYLSSVIPTINSKFLIWLYFIKSCLKNPYIIIIEKYYMLNHQHLFNNKRIGDLFLKFRFYLLKGLKISQNLNYIP